MIRSSEKVPRKEDQTTPHIAVRAHRLHNPLELREPQSVCLVLQLCGGLIEMNAGAGPASCTGLTLNPYFGGFLGLKSVHSCEAYS